MDEEMTMAEHDALMRAEELERRAWEGGDDIASCLKWAGVHRRLIEASQAERRRRKFGE